MSPPRDIEFEYDGAAMVTASREIEPQRSLSDRSLTPEVTVEVVFALGDHDRALEYLESAYDAVVTQINEVKGRSI